MPKIEPENWRPPYNAYSGALDSDAVDLAVIGFQSADPDEAARWAHTAADELVDSGVSRLQTVVGADADGPAEHILISYWPDEGTAEEVLSGSTADRWTDELSSGPTGWWCESFHCPLPRLETNSSRADAHYGAARPAQWQLDDRIGYDGAARDRIDAAEDEGLPGSMHQLPLRRPLETVGRAIQVSVPDNLCFIRTVQGWRDAPAEEREAFLSGPYLSYLDGVSYLRSNPRESGCASVRLVDNPSEAPHSPQKETLAWFTSLADLETWVWYSPTHGEIMRSFTDYAQRFSMDIDILLSHEVYVVSARDAHAVYVNCHPTTGLLGWFRHRPLRVPS